MYDELYQLHWSKVNKNSEVIGTLATDMWRSSAASHGLPIMNCCLLLPEGGSLFHDATVCDDVKKDVDWVVSEHNRLALELTDNHPEKLAGVIMDNTKVNRLALERLEKEHPGWIGLGCQAHALQLVLKDLANPAKSPWCSHLFTAAKDISKVSPYIHLHLEQGELIY